MYNILVLDTDSVYNSIWTRIIHHSSKLGCETISGEPEGPGGGWISIEGPGSPSTPGSFSAGFWWKMLAMNSRPNKTRDTPKPPATKMNKGQISLSVNTCEMAVLSGPQGSSRNQRWYFLCSLSRMPNSCSCIMLKYTLVEELLNLLFQLQKVNFWFNGFSG